jgi:hypothetical protein
MRSMKILLLAAACATLAGCYNPRYPSEVPGDRAIPQETGNSQETSVRERRDGAAASGTTTAQ